jgi:hypothetical protein
MTRLADIPNISIRHFTNNCSLVAVKEISGAPDRVILELFQNRGYIPHRGTRDHQYLGVLSDLQIEYVNISTSVEGRSALVEDTDDDGYATFRLNAARYVTLKQFCAEHPEGVFLVRGNGHAWVVRDGRVIDPNVAQGARKRLGRRVENAWHILNPGPSTYAEKVGAETYKLKRGEDPLVRFRYPSTFRKRGTKCFAQEYQARCYINQFAKVSQRVRLSDLTSGTSYDRSIAAWDLKHGHLEVVKE